VPTAEDLYPQGRYNHQIATWRDKEDFANDHYQNDPEAYEKYLAAESVGQEAVVLR
jgi:hypothetical protein